jgi:hypothetical protein
MRPGRLQRVASLGPILEVNLTYLKQAATSQSDPTETFAAAQPPAARNSSATLIYCDRVARGRGVRGT